MAARPTAPLPVPVTGPVTTPFAEARVMFSLLDRNSDTWLDGIRGEYVRIHRRGDGTSGVADHGELLRHIGRGAGDTSAISMVQYMRFVASFDLDANGSLDAAEWARYAAFLTSHTSHTFGATP